MTRTDFFSRSASETSDDGPAPADEDHKGRNQVMKVCPNAAALPWSPLQCGDSPAALSLWKKASIGTPGPGLLLVHGLRRLTGTKVSPEDPLAENANDLVAEASSVSSSTPQSVRDVCVPKRRRPANVPRSDQDAQLSFDSRDAATDGSDGDIRGCSVGVVVELRYRLGTGGTPAAREKMKRMMHRVLSDQLFSATVRVDASADEIGQRLHVNPVFVSRNWILSDQKEADSQTELLNQPSFRMATQAKYDADPPTVGMSLQTQLDIGLSKPVDKDVLHLALQKAARNTACDMSNGDLCGMDKGASNSGLDLSCNNFLVEGRPGTKGLYQTAVTRGEIEVDWRSPAKTAASCYTEFRMMSKQLGAGICLGVYNADMDVRTKLVGATPGSIGFHSDGKLVVENKWTPYGEGFGEGDIIGMHIQFHPAPINDTDRIVEYTHGNGDGIFRSSSETSSETGGSESEGDYVDRSVIRPRRNNTFVEITFTKNGVSLGRTSNRLFLPAYSKLRAAVSMYRPGSKVEMRCCLGSTGMPKYGLPTGTRSICQATQSCKGN